MYKLPIFGFTIHYNLRILCNDIVLSKFTEAQHFISIPIIRKTSFDFTAALSWRRCVERLYGSWEILESGRRLTIYSLLCFTKALCLQMTRVLVMAHELKYPSSNIQCRLKKSVANKFANINNIGLFTYLFNSFCLLTQLFWDIKRANIRDRNGPFSHPDKYEYLLQSNCKLYKLARNSLHFWTSSIQHKPFVNFRYQKVLQDTTKSPFFRKYSITSAMAYWVMHESGCVLNFGDLKKPNKSIPSKLLTMALPAGIYTMRH